MYKILFAVMFVMMSCNVYSQTNPAGLRSILLEQLKTTHDTKDWFVPVNIAVEGLTYEQAIWTDGSGNHSIAQLISHLVFWNQQQLAKLKGEKEPHYSGDNNDTFGQPDKDSWKSGIKRLDSLMKEWEKFVTTVPEAKLNESASTVAHIGTHNAYHTGQIIYIRKLQHSWDESKGVK